MTRNSLKRALKSSVSAARSRTRSFARAEDGSLTLFTLAAAVIMLIFGGLGIDFMLAEMKRAKAQAVLDRSVLAAAALNQELDPKGVVNDYFVRHGASHLLKDVQAESGLNYRRVWAATDEDMTPFVGHNFDLQNIDVITEGTAEQYARNVEIALVIDVSGSMAKHNRMTNMQTAAETFINLAIDPAYPDSTALSLVPYTEQVAIGADLFNELKVNVKHAYSYCLEIPNGHFNSATFNTGHTYTQMQHYQWNYDGSNSTTHPLCPVAGSAAEIAPWQSNAQALINRVNAMTPQTGTSIFLGVKWGTAMLDSSFRTVAGKMAGAGKINAKFNLHPLDYGRADNSKHLVLMTDGENDKSSRIKNKYYNDSIAELNDGVDYDGDGLIYDIGYWANNNFWWHLDKKVSWKQWGNWYDKTYNTHGKNWGGAWAPSLTENICKAARNKGITIWTVAFEATSTGEDMLKKCATSPAHHFKAEGTQIETAFAAIARAIKQVRLTQ